MLAMMRERGAKKSGVAAEGNESAGGGGVNEGKHTAVGEASEMLHAAVC